MKTRKYKTIQKSISLLVFIFFAFFLSSLTAKGLAVKKINNALMEKQTSLKITKNTSLDELENIKKQMKEKGFEFDYSNVVYNDIGEIISISISYKDANNNSGNYSVGSENPINDIIIISNGNQISVKTQGSGNQVSINQANRDKAYKDRQKMMEERNAEIAKKRSEMDKKMVDRMQEMKERQTQMRARMEHERDSVYGKQRIKSAQIFNGNYNIITKHTTEAEFLELEEAYKAENILFSYNQLEHNASGLITRISITVNNGKGSVSTSSFGNGKDPINDISVGVDSENIIMKSAQ